MQWLFLLAALHSSLRVSLRAIEQCNKDSDMMNCFQEEVKRLTGENEAIKRQAELDKEKLHALEAAMEELQRRGENIVECTKA